MRHYLPEYLENPTHAITVTLIGCGGTGSQMLTQLVRIHTCLKALGKPGLHVICYDNDVITQANKSRQNFYENDMGKNKAVVLITRVNRLLEDANWQAVPMHFQKQTLNENQIGTTNFYISCVDKVSSRRGVQKVLDALKYKRTGNYCSPYYWIDAGNSKETGQFVLGTIGRHKSNKKKKDHVGFLPNIFDLAPDMEAHEQQDDTPSCSLMEAIEKQDLFINTAMAMYMGQMLYKLLKDGFLDYHGAFVNIQTMMNPKIKIQA